MLRGLVVVTSLALMTLTASAPPSSAPAAAPIAAPTAAVAYSWGKTALSSPLPALTQTKPSSTKITASLKRYLKGRAGYLSISFKDLTTGFSYTYNPGLRTATASIVKVEILIALLLQAQAAHRKVTGAQKSLASRMIRNSDNDAATALYNLIGGSPGLARANRQLGLKNTVPGPPSYWGSTTTSARDQIRILKALTVSPSPLTKEHRQYVLRLMAQVSPGQDWGVSAAGGQVALKNGWLPRPVHGGRWTINSIGRATTKDHDYLIAVLSDRHPSMNTGITTVAQVVKQVVRLVERAGA